MSAPLPFQSGPRKADMVPFPMRGMPDGWRDPWDADPYDAVVAALRQQRALRRQVTEAGVQIELLAQARADGRWEAHVAAGNEPGAMWPSTNGPTASVALDALEAELRELIRDSVL